MTTDSTTPSAADAQRPALPPSPCVGICALKGDYCYGCGRTGDEIAAWGSLTPADQSAVWAELPARLAAFGFKTFRLAAGPAVVNEFIGRTFCETAGKWRLVSPSVEGSIAINPDTRPEIVETDDYVLATADNGDWLRLIKHGKVRIFGFASQDQSRGGTGCMDTVALVLPKGRAQRDLQDDTGVLPHGYAAIGAPDVFTEVVVKPIGLSETAASLDGITWDDARARLPDIITGKHARLTLRNALGCIETSSPILAETLPASDANAPADMKISRAFVAGAIFHADDPQWLAKALAP